MIIRDIPEPATVVAARDLLASEFGDEIVVLNLRGGVYYGLEGVGVYVWKLLKEPISVRAIRDAVVAEFDVAPGRCERDIRAFLLELAVKGLVEIRESA